jgi:hypothetical protein
VLCSHFETDASRRLDIKEQSTKDEAQFFMSPKEIAAHYGAKLFDTPDAATAAGFVLTERHAPRNVWNKASATQSLLLGLRDKKEKGEIKEMGLVNEPFAVTGCYLPNNAQAE